MLGDGRTPTSDYVVEKITVSPHVFPRDGHSRYKRPGVDGNRRCELLFPSGWSASRWPAISGSRETPIGKRLSVSDKPQTRDWLTIVGVVKDIRQEMETTRRRRAVYQASARRHPSRFMTEVAYHRAHSIEPGPRSVGRCGRLCTISIRLVLRSRSQPWMTSLMNGSRHRDLKCAS